MIVLDQAPLAPATNEFATGPDTGFTENLGASATDQLVANDGFGYRLKRDMLRAQRDSLIKERTGESPFWQKFSGGAEGEAAYAKHIEDLNRLYPEIQTNQQIEDQIGAEARTIEQKASDVSQRATFLGKVGAFLGSSFGWFADPRNAAMVLGTHGLPIAPTVAGRVLTQGALNAGMTAFTEPDTQAERVQHGLEGGFWHGVQNVAVAGAFGAGLQGFAEGLPAAIGQIPGAVGALKRSGGTFTDAVKQVIDKVREGKKLTDGDIAGMAEAAPGNATSSEMAAVNALERDAETIRANPLAGENEAVALAAHSTRLNQAVEALAKNEPVDLGPPTQLKPNVVVAPDEQLMPVRDIQVDAKRFQFKSGADAQGVTDRLKGVKEWNPDLAGTIFVYEDQAGNRFAADGHQRVALGKRIEAENPGTEIQARVRLLREADGWTPERARAYAAGINVAQGTGSSLDAAKVLRVAPEALPPLPPQSALVRDARGLAALNEDVFMQAINGQLDERYAALIGRMESDEMRQAALSKLIKQVEPDTIAEAQTIIRQAQASGFTKEKTTDLFGTQDVAESLYKERAKVLGKALQLLRQDKAVFKTLIENQQTIENAGKNVLDTLTNEQQAALASKALAQVEKLANIKGPISEALNDAAREAKNTGRFSDAARKFARSVGERLDGSLPAGEPDGGAAFDADPAQEIRARIEQAQTTSAEAIDQLTEREPQDIEAAFRDLKDQASMPAALSSSGPISPAMIAEAGGTLEGTQALPFQANVRPRPSSPFMTARISPSSLKGFAAKIGTISTTSGKIIYQASQSAKRNVTLAKQYLGEIGTFLKTFEEIPGIKYEGARVKGEDRLNEKLLNRNPAEVSDYLATRFIADTRGAIDQLVTAIGQDTKIVHMESTLDGSPSGYRAMHLQVLADSGFSYEIQILPREIREVYSANHEIYQELRNKETFTTEDVVKMNEAKAKFDEAYARFETRSADEGTALLPEKPTQTSPDLIDQVAVDVQLGTDGNISPATMTIEQVVKDLEEDDNLLKAIRTCLV